MGAVKEMAMNQREQEQAEQNTPAKTNTALAINSQSFLTANKEDIKTKAMAVTDEYLDGHKSPAEGLIIVKKLIDFAEQVKENLSGAAAAELRLGTGESRTVSGNKINEQMVGVKYSFKECGDPIWNELNEKIKEREAFLKTIKGSKYELIEDTGELAQIFEPVKSGKLGLIIKY